jgi:F-type H+-transporting ATPase subunit epsilon
MAKIFDLNIITPDAPVYEGKVSSLVAPSKLGYMGVLADHAPIIAALKPGKITLKEASGGRKVFDSVSEGFLEAMNNRAVILLSSSH